MYLDLNETVLNSKNFITIGAVGGFFLFVFYSYNRIQRFKHFTEEFSEKSV